MFCSGCGAAVPAGSEYCQSCGQRVGGAPPCSECGAPLKPGSQFCTSCGKPADVAEAPTLGATAPAARPQPSEAPTAVSAAAVAARAPAPPIPAGVPWGPHAGGPGGFVRPRPLTFATVTQILAAVAVVVVATCSLVVTTVSSPPTWLARWIFLLPPPTGKTAYQAETAIFIAVALTTGITCATRTPAARVAAPLLTLLVVGVLVGNAIDLSTQGFAGGDYLAFIFNQPESIATWVVGVLVLAGGFTGLFGAHASGRVAAAWGVGAAVCGIAAVVAATSTPSFSALGDAAAPLGSGSASAGGAIRASAGENVPGSCATGWSTDIDVTTSDMRATVCSAESGVTYLVMRRADGTDLNAPAEPSGAGWHATSGAFEYEVDPDVIAVYQGGQLETDEAALGSSSASPAHEPPAFSRLAALVQIAHDGRLAVRRLQRLTLDGHCSSVSASTSLIRQVMGNRQQLTRAAAQLQNRVASAGLPVADFERAMRNSLDADRAWSRWISGTWRRWINRGCTGTASRGSNLRALGRYSRLATRAKATFVQEYDPIAAQHGRRSDWTDVDI